MRIEDLHPFLTEWTQSGEHLQKEVANYLAGHFLGEPLRDWDICRAAGSPISVLKYRTARPLLVCLFDAPIGYVASTK